MSTEITFFEAIRHTHSVGNEFGLGGCVARLLGYATYRNFQSGIGNSI